MQFKDAAACYACNYTHFQLVLKFVVDASLFGFKISWLRLLITSHLFAFIRQNSSIEYQEMINGFMNSISDRNETNTKSKLRNKL